MGKKRLPIKTSIKQIVDYWSVRVDEMFLSVDWAEAHERCWRCARKTRLERCHIIPHSRGGEDTPSNFVLLCKKCHLENPNITDTEIMWDWLKAYQTTFYDTLWIIEGFVEYKKIYHQDFLEQLQRFEINDVKQIEALIKEKMQGSIRHFAEPHFNMATVAGILRMIYKDIEKNNSGK